MTELTKLKRMNASLNKQKSFAWGKFYEESKSNHKLLLDKYESEKKLCESVGLPVHIQTEIKELMKITKKEVECYICYENIEVDKIVWSSCKCNTKICGECYDKIDTCGLCRGKIYKKK
tara:strand:+ start:304 stop:660 length:357 start_codon:yes stop_codon:yes gene_type:complete